MPVFSVKKYPKDAMTCVKTGISFNHDGEHRRGDLFLNTTTGDMCIYGIPSSITPFPMVDGASTFFGELTKGPNGYNATLEGSIALNEDDMQYVKRNCRYVENFAI